VDAHYVFAVLLMAMGRLSESRAQIEHAARVDPLSAQVQSVFGRILYRARQFDPAVERLNRAIELEPRNGIAHGGLADAYALSGAMTRPCDTLAPSHAIDRETCTRPCR